jgi:tetratricopeptide (TPR) repeat protein
LAWLAPALARGDREALSLQGRALEAVGDLAGALEAWKAAEDFAALTDAGAHASRGGQLGDALAAYEAAYAVEPERGTAYLASFLWSPYYDAERAEAVLRRALADNTDSLYRPRWLRMLGEYLQAEERWPEASATYQQLLAENPVDWQAEIALGWVIYHQGDGFQPAQSHFLRAVEIAPDRGEGYLAIGQLLAREGRYEEADLWVLRAQQTTPDEPWYWVARGNVAREAERVLRSLEIYSEAQETFPQYVPVYYEMAWAYRLANRPDAAIQAIGEALDRQGGSDPWYYVRAGEIYEWAGDLERAEEAYRSALEVAPGHVAAGRAAQAGLDRVHTSHE